MKWDYQIREYQAQVLSDLERALAAAGSDGWELVLITPHLGIPPSLPPVNLAILKRPAVDGAIAAAPGSTVTVIVKPAP